MFDEALELALKVAKPIRTRVANMIARAVLSATDDSQGVQLVQLVVLDGETRSDVERMQDYGFTSNPLDGAEAVVIFVDGDRGHGHAVKIDDRRYRPTNLQKGEVCVYNSAGAQIRLKPDGSITMNSAPGKDIILNGGTQPIARVGDSAGPYPIVGGASNVKA
jgi:phage baseplate assembly protein V